MGNCAVDLAPKEIVNWKFKSHIHQVHLFQTIFKMHFHFLYHIWVRVDCKVSKGFSAFKRANNGPKIIKIDQDGRQ